MAINRRNWSDTDMDTYFALAKKYYPNRKEDGFILDSGANIGTTCIYFKKYLDPKVKILAFEPLKENYNLLITNLMLNEINANDFIAEELGLSNKTRKGKMKKVSFNPAGTGLSLDMEAEGNQVDCVALDDYFSEHGFKAEDLKYMWLDAEGSEPYILEGSRSILSSGNVPLYMEFSPFAYASGGKFDDFMRIVEKFYTKVIYMPEANQGAEILHSISELRNFIDKKDFQMDIFFIK